MFLAQKIVDGLLGIPDTSFKGRNTRMALNIFESNSCPVFSIIRRTVIDLNANKKCLIKSDFDYLQISNDSYYPVTTTKKSIIFHMFLR